MNQLSVWDYSVIVGYVIGVLALGLMFSGRQKSLKEYFLASGNLPWWAVSCSVYATALSPLTFLGSAGWIFMKDSRMAVSGSLIGYNEYSIRLKCRFQKPSQAFEIIHPKYGQTAPFSIKDDSNKSNYLL